MLFIPLLLIFALVAPAQEKTSKEKQKYKLRIVKEVEGVKTEIDTTFETHEDFDVDAWMKAHDFDHDRGDMDRKMKQLQKEITVTIPDFTGESPDTIIVNGDTIFPGREGKGFSWTFKDMPELEDLDIDRHLKLAEEPFEFRDMPGLEELSELPPCCKYNFRFPGMCHPLPDLFEMMPFGRPDQIIIKKSRNGKKMIIKFEDDDNQTIIIPRHGSGQYHYFNNMPECEKKCDRKVIIHRDDKPGKEGEKNTRIKRIKEGDKEIIIIRKGSDDK
jgi:hypothetical protein